MRNPILDNESSPFLLRTKDLVFAEGITIIALFIAVIWSFSISNSALMATLSMLIGPGLYTLFWRQRSIIYEFSDPDQNLQSGMTIMLFIWSLLECMLVLPTAFVLFIESITQGFALIKIFHIVPFLAAVIFTFYLLKTFSRSIKLDAQNPSI
jgi:hypothetical protein